jgi:hypothetical protein
MGFSQHIAIKYWNTLNEEAYIARDLPARDNTPRNTSCRNNRAAHALQLFFKLERKLLSSGIGVTLDSKMTDEYIGVFPPPPIYRRSKHALLYFIR